MSPAEAYAVTLPIPLRQGQQQVDGGGVVMLEASWYVFIAFTRITLSKDSVHAARQAHALVEIVENKSDSCLQGVVVSESLSAHLTKKTEKKTVQNKNKIVAGTRYVVTVHSCKENVDILIKDTVDAARRNHTPAKVAENENDHCLEGLAVSESLT